MCKSRSSVDGARFASWPLEICREQGKETGAMLACSGLLSLPCIVGKV